MPLSERETELRPLARECIAKGRLPRNPPAKLWGGRGSGELCALCGKPIERDQVEYEVEVSLDGTVRTFRFHIVCQSVWQLECARDDHFRERSEDTVTGIAPVIAGDSHPARGMRLRLQFLERELLVEERHSSLTLGRSEDNGVVVKGHLISRLHARIEISRNGFVLIDQSTNGTFVQTADGEELFVRRDILQLKGQGMIGLGRLPEPGSPHTIRFTCEES
jgi:hypothetical protein